MKKIEMEQIKQIAKSAGKVISLLSILFIVYAVYKLGFDFSSITNWPGFLAVSAVCVLIKSVTVFVMGLAWTDWLKLFSGKVFDKKAALSAYVKANIGKYLPGNVMHYIERNLFASNLGISQKRMAASTIIEMFGLAAIAFFMAMLFSLQYLLAALEEIFGESYQAVLMAAVVLAVAVGGCLLFLFRKKIGSLIQECGAGNFARTLVGALLKYAVVLWALGFIMVILYWYMGGKPDWHSVTLIISGFIIAWVLGFLIPGASGGIGVRELVSVALLSAVTGRELILTLSVVHRLITIIGDFVSYLVAIIWKRKEKTVRI
ncbi:MAG: hypothetical protein LIO86_01985 [Lachnospiraceae bacterium]|nr:hypothetical protein [Lachnospiraceae bacterium]